MANERPANNMYGDVETPQYNVPGTGPAAAPRMYTGREPTALYNPSRELTKAQYGNQFQQTSDDLMRQIREPTREFDSSKRKGSVYDSYDARMARRDLPTRKSQWEIDTAARNARVGVPDRVHRGPGGGYKDNSAAGAAAEAAVRAQYAAQNSARMQQLGDIYKNVSSRMNSVDDDLTQRQVAAQRGRNVLLGETMRANANARANDIAAYTNQGLQAVTAEGSRQQAWAQSLPIAAELAKLDAETRASASKFMDAPPPTTNLFGQVFGGPGPMGQGNAFYEQSMGLQPGAPGAPAGGSAAGGAADPAVMSPSAFAPADPAVMSPSAFAPTDPAVMSPSVFAPTDPAVMSPVAPEVVAASPQSAGELSSGALDRRTKRDVATGVNLSAQDSLLRQQAASLGTDFGDAYSPELQEQLVSLIRQHGMPAEGDLKTRSAMQATAFNNLDSDLIGGKDRPVSADELITGVAPRSDSWWGARSRWLANLARGNFDAPWSGRVGSMGGPNASSYELSNLPDIIYNRMETYGDPQPALPTFMEAWNANLPPAAR